MSWYGGPIKRDEVIPGCVNCGKISKSISVGSAIAKLAGGEWEVVGLWHCESCNSVYEGIAPKLIGMIDKKVRFTPANSVTIAGQKDKPKTAMEDMRERVLGFKLK